MGVLTLVGRLRGGVAALHSGQSLRYPPKERLHVVAQLGAGLDEHQVVLLGLLLALLRRDLPLVVEIGLVANEYDNDIVSSLGPDVVDPFPRVLEGLRVYSLPGCLSASVASFEQCSGDRRRT